MNVRIVLFIVTCCMVGNLGHVGAQKQNADVYESRGMNQQNLWLNTIFTF